MVTRMGPFYANLLMGKLEQEFLQTQNKKPPVWWRYIDHTFAIWTYDKQSLRTIVENLNCQHPIIKYTASWSAEEAIYWDTRVCLKNGQIKTDLHTKPTDKHQYLCMESCHPKHCKNAIPYSQALRLCRICWEEENLLKRTSDLKKYFLRRGYNEQLLDKL